MDPLSAIGLASAIVQFVDFSIKIAELTHAFYKNHGELPRDISRVKLVVDDLVPLLQRLKQTQTSTNGAAQAEKFGLLVAASLKEAKSFTQILEKLTVSDRHSGFDSFRAALNAFRKLGKIQGIERSLEGYRSAITLHLAEATLGRV